MPRPRSCRRISHSPSATIFKPAGVPRRDLDEVVLGLDELEALRLADLEGLYQEQAAERMGVSRATFSRIVETARRTVAEALVRGKALRIEGGVVHTEDERCPRCRAESATETCPHCSAADGAGADGPRRRGCGRRRRNQQNP